ncbi:DUF4230 domain-containing protein [Adhaeribacter radiodurans]|uniref:DUF4230 domain-containing protein n=1 Tax=Adhaeribacter radiodurans TaxID=2745197 RepID=A0A7L7LD95_9BACT|nr:DUF4230 domain-containing protein [Adhaeribacter radiodurans]QMU30812.1 DUF4230 domain-containing protein [Adhaeribacter radiodurans]
MLRYIIRRLIPWILIAIIGFFVWRKLGSSFSTDKATVKITHNTILEKIDDLGNLELVRYNFKDVVEYEKEVSQWLPNSKSVLIVAGEAVGCIDLRQVTAQDITFTNDSVITVKLPEPQICYFKVDHNKSKVFAMQNTYFQDAELVDEGYKFAEKHIRQSALNSGILQQTAVNADKILKPLLESLTGKQIILEHKHTTKAPPVLPKR